MEAIRKTVKGFILKQNGALGVVSHWDSNGEPFTKVLLLVPTRTANGDMSETKYGLTIAGDYLDSLERFGTHTMVVCSGKYETKDYRYENGNTALLHNIKTSMLMTDEQFKSLDVAADVVAPALVASIKIAEMDLDDSFAS